jgi:hypothetical protein
MSDDPLFRLVFNVHHQHHPHPSSASSSTTNQSQKRSLEEAKEGVTKKIKFDGILPIHKVSHEPRDRPDWNPLIPETPFFVICIGRSNTGKTTLLVNLLLNKRAYKGKYDRIFVFHPNFHEDSTYRKVKWKNARVFTEWKPEELAELVEDKKEWVRKFNDQQEMFKKRKLSHRDLPESEVILPPPRDLIIVDDSIASGITNPYKFGPLDKLATSGRKIYTDVWFTAHKWLKQVTPTMRTNATHIIAFDMPDAREYESLRDGVRPSSMKAKRFDDIFRESTKDPYNFLFVDRKKPNELRFSHNFDTPFVIPQ